MLPAVIGAAGVVGPAEVAGRIAAVVMVAGAAHVAVILLRRLAARALQSRIASFSKIKTLTGFVASSVVFAIYFAAAGFVLKEAGVALTTYLASATVIGLAVSFGSQGLVQDVISGLTIMIADVVDVGDMVDVGGQVGIVRRIGIRYLILVNFQGAVVSIPNRNVANVVNFRAGYVRAYIDLRAPAGGGELPLAALRAAAEAAHRQFSGAMLLPPSVVSLAAREQRPAVTRVKFRIWPGQTAIIEGPVRQSLLAAMREVDPGYPDWAAAVHYRAEPEAARQPLPRPAAVEAKLRERREASQ